MAPSRALVLFALVVAPACGAREGATSPIVFVPGPTTADAGTGDGGASASKEEAPRDASTSPEAFPRPVVGANGPKDAVGIAGTAGQVVPASAEMTLFVHTRAMRAHPKGLELGRTLIASLGKWGAFLPYDAMHPLRDTDWVLLAGSPVGTEKNVFLVRHHLDDKRGSALERELERRLPGRPLDLRVAGVSAIAATVDGAERAYARATPGWLAIVPKADGERTAEILRKARPPMLSNDAELVRLIFTRPPARVARLLPPALGPSRVWIEVDGPNLTLNGESDCADEPAAVTMTEEIRTTLRGVRGIAAMMARPLLEGARLWADGRTVRYQAVLDDTMLGLLSMAVCGSDANCGLPR